MVKEILLTQGKKALVDDEDYARLIKYKWHIARNIGGYYAKRNAQVDGERHTIYMHRVITNAPKGVEIDHHNHNTLDNRKQNLRLATGSQNLQNQKKSLTRNGKPYTSRYKGVSWHKCAQKWRARIYINGKVKQLGCFESEIEAAHVYDAAAKKYFGEYSLLNFPDT